MTYHALIQNNVVVEIVTPEAYATFNPSVQALFVPCPTTVTVGYTYANGLWIAPVVPPALPIKYPILSPMQFYLAFTPAERIAIKKSQDPEVIEFWATYQLAVQLNATIDPNLVSVQQGLEYLAAPATATPPGAGILASMTRVTEISNGVAQ